MKKSKLSEGSVYLDNTLSGVPENAVSERICIIGRWRNAIGRLREIGIKKSSENHLDAVLNSDAGQEEWGYAPEIQILRHSVALGIFRVVRKPGFIDDLSTQCEYTKILALIDDLLSTIPQDQELVLLEVADRISATIDEGDVTRQTWEDKFRSALEKEWESITEIEEAASSSEAEEDKEGATENQMLFSVFMLGFGKILEDMSQATNPMMYLVNAFGVTNVTDAVKFKKPFMEKGYADPDTPEEKKLAFGEIPIRYFLGMCNEIPNFRAKGILKVTEEALGALEDCPPDLSIKLGEFSEITPSRATLLKKRYDHGVKSGFFEEALYTKNPLNL